MRVLLKDFLVTFEIFYFTFDPKRTSNKFKSILLIWDGYINSHCYLYGIEH